MAKKKENTEEKVKTGTTIIDSPISIEMKKSYLDYAMSVITARALPDVRDGLKPVHRRILFSLYKKAKELLGCFANLVFENRTEFCRMKIFQSQNPATLPASYQK